MRKVLDYLADRPGQPCQVQNSHDFLRKIGEQFRMIVAGPIPRLPRRPFETKWDSEKRQTFYTPSSREAMILRSVRIVLEVLERARLCVV